MRRFVDLSIYLENDVISDPPAMKPNIDYVTHDVGAQQMASFFPGLAPGDLPDGEGWAIEFVQLCTHNGTHLDAPYHFHPTMNEHVSGKERAITIDEQSAKMFEISMRRAHARHIDEHPTKKFENSMRRTHTNIRRT